MRRSSSLGKRITFLFTAFISLAFFRAGGEYQIKVPKGFPEPPIPEENQLTKARVELGRRLFFDPIMSRDRTVSCATCHKPELAFTDGLTKSKGITGQELLRNAPTLVNLAYQDSGFFADRGVPTLEMQVPVPVLEKHEFDFELYLIAERMKKDEAYLSASKKAYDREPDPYVITRAISAFERTLISGNSRFDQFKNGNKKALSKSEQRGMSLFFDELLCESCHPAPFFTDFSVQNIGLYPKPYPLDSGRMRITNKVRDMDKFKVPTLRNIELTKPYMHDGSMATLDEVIDHYISGGHKHPNKSEFMKVLTISEEQKTDLIAFLKSLTDEEFVSFTYK